MNRSLKLKKNLREGKVCYGAWLATADASIAEVMAGVGFDWIIIDSEHSPFNLETLQHILMAFKGSETVPLVRVGWNDRVEIKRVLDMGGDGIVVPWVGSEDEARQVVAACRYPPVGSRGFGPRRASDYYKNLDPLEKYVQEANESVVVVIQIEHIDAVQRIEHILAVPGIDVVMLGPMDLSGTMGLLGQLDHPRVMAAIEHVMAEAKQRGLAVGVPIEATPEVAADWIMRGSQFATLGEDVGFLRRAATDALALAKSVASRSGKA